MRLPAGTGRTSSVGTAPRAVEDEQHAPPVGPHARVAEALAPQDRVGANNGDFRRGDDFLNLCLVQTTKPRLLLPGLLDLIRTQIS